MRRPAGTKTAHLQRRASECCAYLRRIADVALLTSTTLEVLKYCIAYDIYRITKSSQKYILVQLFKNYNNLKLHLVYTCSKVSYLIAGEDDV